MGEFDRIRTLSEVFRADEYTLRAAKGSLDFLPRVLSLDFRYQNWNKGLLPILQKMGVGRGDAIRDAENACSDTTRWVIVPCQLLLHTVVRRSNGV